jgi:hypothetical protein
VTGVQSLIGAENASAAATAATDTIEEPTRIGSRL